MREELIQIRGILDDKDRPDAADLIKLIVTGAELIPMPETMIKKGKPVRPLMMQYLQERAKKGE